MSNLSHIQEVLKKYKPNNNNSLAAMYFAKTDRMMTWQINNICNFNCAYCGKFVKDEPDVYKYSPEHIAKCFDNEGFTWHIIITGGEPFMHRHFLDIAQALTKNHYISVNTNLSLPTVTQFADAVNPEKVILINASIHWDMRQQKQTLNDFIDKFLYLQQKGFQIVGSYVVYPDALHRYKEDIAYLKSKGLKHISSKVFHGVYEQKTYPASYTSSEIKDISELMDACIEMPEYLEFYQFKGLRCSTGRTMLSMKPNGNIERCLTDYTPQGNFFEGTFSCPPNDKKCVQDICTCPYQGMLYTYKKRGLFGF